jgi:hypothetical protein
MTTFCSAFYESYLSTPHPLPMDVSWFFHSSIIVIFSNFLRRLAFALASLPSSMIFPETGNLGGGICSFRTITPSIPSVVRSWQAFTATFAKNYGHFRSFHGHLSKNMLLHDNSKHNNNKKLKNIMSGEGFVIFFLFVLSIFGLNITQIF